MADKLYRIRPICWDQTSAEEYYADVPPFGRIEVYPVYEQMEFEGFMFWLTFIPNKGLCSNRKVYRTPTAAMKAAETFYRKWLVKALTSKLEN